MLPYERDVGGGVTGAALPYALKPGVRLALKLDRRDALLYGGVLLVAAILGGIGGYLLFEKTVTVEALSNIGVAVGTLALAYFTWQSVSNTRDVIRSEDRRHMSGFYPLLFLHQVQNIGGKAEWGIQLVNEGAGVTPRGQFEIEGEYRSKVWKGGSTANGFLDPKPFVVSGNFGLVALNPNNNKATVVPVEAPPANYSEYILRKVRLRYQDVFGNEYVTDYDDWQDHRELFEWRTPPNLRPNS